MFKSTNGGGSWGAVNAGLTPTDSRALAIDPKTPTTLYVGTGGGGVFAQATAGPPVAISAAVLPSSRSVKVGTPATAFATILASGPGTGRGCFIAPPLGVPGTFSFQTTNPATNEVTGTPNAAVDIPGGGGQSFVFAFTPTASFGPTDVQMAFDCSNTEPAPIISGVTTILLSASANPPDIVALAATLTSNGIVDISAATGSGVFAVATVNVGASSMIIATADTGSASLPVNVSLCQTNSATGQCISNVGASVTTQINAGATPTFAFFLTGTDTVPFDPAHNRVFVRFKDEGQVVRG